MVWLNKTKKLVTQQRKQSNNFGGGLGDATVTQSGVWGRIPQFCWLF
ncbi:hypothetical protein FDUTEX481_01020 [Tolypothrix sp. PCC 7601]|nr:hypothetical protein FDUTEX481_01020 [Tolypothrix sp. PCC 7601]